MPRQDDRYEYDDIDEEESYTPEQTQVLDRAAEHQDEFDLHEGAIAYEEEQPGAFWSIEVVDAYKSFGDAHILQGVNLGIPEGMVTVILGPSGTGKSVLISHLIGLMFPDQGDIIVHGESLRSMKQSRLMEVRKKFGILFQDGALFGSMNIFDNVAFPLRQHTNMKESEIEQRVGARLEEVGLTQARERFPDELSGGMKKRAGFARALVLEPGILMFDEPDSGLDPVRTALLSRLIRKMHTEHGGTYIVITHNTSVVRELGDYIAVLWRGKIVQAGSRDDMFTSRNPFVRQFLAGAEEGPLGMD